MDNDNNGSENLEESGAHNYPMRNLKLEQNITSEANTTSNGGAVKCVSLEINPRERPQTSKNTQHQKNSHDFSMFSKDPEMMQTQFYEQMQYEKDKILDDMRHQVRKMIE